MRDNETGLLLIIAGILIGVLLSWVLGFVAAAIGVYFLARTRI